MLILFGNVSVLTLCYAYTCVTVIRDADILRVYCQSAEKLGRSAVSALEKPRRVAILVNSAARDG